MNTVAARRAHPALPALLVLALSAAALVRALRPRSGLIAPEPVAVEGLFDAEHVRRARRFGRPQLALGMAGTALDGAVLLALSRHPPRMLRAARRPRAGAALAGAGLTAALTLASLPLSALARRRALSAGLATGSWRSWGNDLVRSTAIGASLSGVAAGGAVALMRARGERWWVPAAGLGTGAALALSFISPVVLEPLFNRFEPLPAGELRDDVLGLARSAGVRVREVYVVDASRRTTAANAYVSGLGASRRVVLWDTLVREFSPAEARAVVAHELAHVRYRDVWGTLSLSAALAPVAARALARTTAELDRSPAPGPGSVAPLALAAGLVGGLLSPFLAARSRQIEARADAFALRLTGDAAPFESFERRIVVQNLADPDPPRWLVALMATHPPAVERIGAARAFAQAARVGEA